MMFDKQIRKGVKDGIQAAVEGQRTAVGSTIGDAILDALSNKVVMSDADFRELIATVFMKGWNMSEYYKGSERTDWMIKERNAITARYFSDLEACRKAGRQRATQHGEDE